MATERWNIDTTHSSIDFVVRHMVVSKTRGTFTKWSGSFEVDTENPAASSAQATLEVGSLDTRDAQRDGHLKSGDFFDAEKHPTITFKSTSVEGAGDKFKLHGDLTLHGATHATTVDVEYNGTNKDPWGNTRAHYSARAKLNRKDFGLSWNQVLEAGGLLIGEEVHVEIEIEALKAPAAA
jgi:polyisoprenoid-binding protein YceI